MIIKMTAKESGLPSPIDHFDGLSEGRLLGRRHTACKDSMDLAWLAKERDLLGCILDIYRSREP